MKVVACSLVYTQKGQEMQFSFVFLTDEILESAGYSYFLNEKWLESAGYGYFLKKK